MTHIAIQEQLDGKAVEWMEKVSDEQQYGNFAPASGGVMGRPYYDKNLFLYSGAAGSRGSRSSKAIWQRQITTRRALRGLTGVDAQSSIAVILLVPAESPERILVRGSLDQPRCVRG